MALLLRQLERTARFKSLDLSQCSLRQEDVKKLGAVMGLNQGLECLFLSIWSFDRHRWQPHRLRLLYPADEELGAQHLSAPAPPLYLHHQLFPLAYNDIDDTAVDAITEAIKRNGTLVKMSLRKGMKTRR